MLKRWRRKAEPEALPDVPGASFGAALLRERTDLLRELARRRVSIDAVLYILEQALCAAVLGDADRKLRRKHQERDVVLRSFRDWARRLRALCTDSEVLHDGGPIASLLEELEARLTAAAVRPANDGNPSDRNLPFGIKGASSSEWQNEALEYLKLLYVPLRVGRELVQAIDVEARARREAAAAR